MGRRELNSARTVKDAGGGFHSALGVGSATAPASTAGTTMKKKSSSNKTQKTGTYMSGREFLDGPFKEPEPGAAGAYPCSNFADAGPTISTPFLTPEVGKGPSSACAQRRAPAPAHGASDQGSDAASTQDPAVLSAAEKWELHRIGQCHPCVAFALKPGGCFKADECTHCHYCTAAQATVRRGKLQAEARRRRRTRQLQQELPQQPMLGQGPFWL